MNLHTVTKIGVTKSGKPVVYFDNKHGYQDMIFLGKTMAPPVGAVIDTEMVSQSRDDKTFWFLNKWGMAPNTMQQSIASQIEGAQMVSRAPESRPLPMNNGTAPIGASPPMSAPSAPYNEPERLWMSNIVAAAINAGCVKSPVDLITWTNGALTALRLVRVAKDTGFDPEVGF